MNGDRLITALDLPAGSHVDKRVPKKLLLENSVSTAADKRLINDGLAELQWLAVLKPTTIGVQIYHDAVREYLEIAVLRQILRVQAKSSRLIELVHRAVPYPLLLISEQEGRTGLSATHKRFSQGVAGEIVLEGDIVIVEWGVEHDDSCWRAFCDALALGKQPRTSLYALYQSWIDTLVALQAARITGKFAIAANSESALARRDALKACAPIESEIRRLRNTAAKEKQLARRIELNLELKRLEAALTAAHANL